MALLPIGARCSGVCETLAHKHKKGQIIEVEAMLCGSLQHGYKLCDGNEEGKLCPQSSKTRVLRPILAFCSDHTEGCPRNIQGSKEGNAQLEQAIQFLHQHQSVQTKGKVRGLLVRRPRTKIICEDEFCWGSGFGDGSIAAAIVPLSIQIAAP